MSFVLCIRNDDVALDLYGFKNALFMKPSKVTLIITKQNFWNIGEVFLGEEKIADINRYYKVDDNFIYIYDVIGGSGTGYSQGNLIEKINISNCEFKLIEK